MTRSIAQLAHELRARTVTAAELVEQALASARARAEINAFITLDEDAARAAARRADAALTVVNGTLAGIPFAHKDIFCTNGIRTTCASRMLDNFVPPYDATVADRLNTAQAVAIGKANMDEFAMGSSNENSAFGAVRNPWDLTRVPGGSSGGSAAAVAAGILPFATGTDTGGLCPPPPPVLGGPGGKADCRQG